MIVEQSRATEIQAGADAGVEANVESQTLRNDAPIQSPGTGDVAVELSKPQNIGREQSRPREQNQTTNPVAAQSEVTGESRKENSRMANQTPQRSQEEVPAS